MTRLRLTGTLVCASEEEAAIVRRLLPEHVRLTRAEAGCRAFDVRETRNPFVWDVSEEFTDESAFEAHQQRVSNSPWGRATAGIVRRYSVEHLPD
ncbi:antibiotic biosynthesis monooxygenase [uncultured Agrococcus sp.]|uniref:putative quinol monooxygenase n=1 Tax=uncultured Agrococcus sp. TaxID=382258 RepID=UPI0025F1B628|nr:antibiotic biosynthesis monooxygenase [uncultured Agrococcus sp.]